MLTETENEKKQIKSAIEQCTVTYTQQAEVDEYSHHYPEISIIVEGNGTHRIMGQDIPCKEGDIYVVNADTLHTFFAADRLTVRHLLFDPAQWFEGANADAASPAYCHGVFSDHLSVAYAMLTHQSRERVIGFYDSIGSELEEKRHKQNSAIACYLSLILITISRYIADSIKATPAGHPKEWITLSSAIHILRDRFTDPSLTLKVIADELYISQSHLSRIFRELVGKSFSEYLREMRTEHACRLLRSGEQSVEEIVLACGLRDVPTFYKMFQEIVGTTPAKYRIKNNPSKGERKMGIIQQISENLQKGKAKIVQELVQQAVDAGASPDEILKEGLLHGMSIIGEKFKNNEIYVPEVLVAARAMNMGTQILKPLLSAEGAKTIGRVCIGTVQGDLHDIGKNLVRMMMEGKGLEVIDLGTDVSADTFIQAAIDHNCDIICCSALLTTTMGVMEEVVQKAKDAGIRDKVKIMVGGAPVNQEFCDKIGADVYTVDAASAADAAAAFCHA